MKFFIGKAFSLSLQISYCLLCVKYSSAKQRIAEQVGGETFNTFFLMQEQITWENFQLSYKPDGYMQGGDTQTRT